jgi:hypothetical protein
MTRFEFLYLSPSLSAGITDAMVGRSRHSAICSAISEKSLGLQLSLIVRNVVRNLRVQQPRKGMKPLANVSIGEIHDF